MSITLELMPEEETRLRAAAAAEGKDLAAYIRQRVFVTAPNVPPMAETAEERRQRVEGNRDPNGHIYRVEDALNALRQLRQDASPISEEQWEAFERGVDDARAGQRSIFRSVGIRSVGIRS